MSHRKLISAMGQNRRMDRCGQIDHRQIVAAKLIYHVRACLRTRKLGARVMGYDAKIPHKSERVGCTHSSTRAEQAAVVMVLQGIPCADDLAHWQRCCYTKTTMLLGSRLPAEHQVKHYDIIKVHAILREPNLRSESSSRTLFVQVYGHSGDPLHEKEHWQ